MLHHAFRDGAADAFGRAGDDGGFPAHVEQGHALLSREV